MNKPGSLPHLDGQRTLAAIVFTDVVGYSARMGSDEEGTLRLFKQDSIQIQGLCEKHEGEIRKFTGDGMLMYFHSAVQAVACALEIQRLQAEKLKTQPAKDVLLHRIGIHLGDVFVSAGDVMGDGVNIAARLQAEAEPGGICVSQTVYDVVKNKIALKATYLGPRELKNISEAVGVYKILLAATDEGSLTHATSDARKKLYLGLAAVGALGLAALLFVLLRPAPADEVAQGDAAGPAPAAETDAAPSTTSAQPQDAGTAAAPATAGVAPATTDSTGAAPATETATTPAATAAPATAQPVQVAAQQQAQPASTPSAPAAAPVLSEREQLLARLRAQAEQRARAETAPGTGSVAPAATAAAEEPLRSVDPETGELLRTPDGTPVDEVVLSDNPLGGPTRGGLGFLDGRSRQDAGAAATSLRQRDFVVAGARKDHQEKLASTQGMRLVSSWFKATLAEYTRERPLRLNLQLPEGWFPVEVWADRNATLSFRSVFGVEEFVYEEIAPHYLGQLLVMVAERRAAQGVRLPDATKLGFRDFGRAFALPKVEALQQTLP